MLPYTDNRFGTLEKMIKHSKCNRWAEFRNLSKQCPFTQDQHKTTLVARTMRIKNTQQR